MAINFDKNIDLPRSTWYYDKTRNNYLYLNFSVNGTGVVLHAGLFGKLTLSICRLKDGKWTRDLAGGAGGWEDHWVPLNQGPVGIFDTDFATLLGGGVSNAVDGLAYLKFNWSDAGCSYEDCKDGFLFVIEETGGIVGGQRVTQYQHIEVYQAWEERYTNHAENGTLGQGVWLQDGAIRTATYVAGAINAAAIATDAIGANELADGAITEPTFADNAVSARVIADDAIDASAIAAEAIGAIEFADLASEEIADKVWDRVATGYEAGANADTMGERLAILARSVLRWDDHSYTTQAEGRVRLVCSAVNAAGRFFGTDVPDDIAQNTEWAGVKGQVYHAATGKTTPFTIVALLNDGANNYFQLRRTSDGTTNISLAVDDVMYMTALTGLSPADVFDEPLLPNHMVPGTVGDALLRMLGLRQHNMQIDYTGWNAAGTPNAGTIYIYGSKADLDADPTITGNNAIGKYQFTGTFDPATLKPLTYKSAVDPNV